MSLYPDKMYFDRLLQLENEKQSLERQLENCRFKNIILVNRLKEVEDEIYDITKELEEWDIVVRPE